MNTTTKAKFRKLDRVKLTVSVPGPYRIGDEMTVASVVNNGTKRNPQWRYYVMGAWYDQDVLESV